MNDLKIPELTFSSVRYGKFETPWDLCPLLYSGGAAWNARSVGQQITRGVFGPPLAERLTLIQRVHEHIEGKLVGGGRRGSAQTTIRRLREFFAWADNSGGAITLTSVETKYVDWTDHLLYRQRIVGDISGLHVYQTAVAVAKVLDEVLELRVGLLAKTRVSRPKHVTRLLGAKADKQNLQETFQFGHAMLDIMNSLNVAAIWGTVPTLIRFRTGQVIEEWLKLKPPEGLKTLRDDVRPSTRKNTWATRIKWETDISIRTRYPLINLRIESEMLVFIAQTGINLEQAHTLKMSKFRYRSHLDGYQVFRVYKGRRHGEVAFDIFSEYREIFDRYLLWRSEIFPNDDDGLLFPLVRAGRAELPPSFSMVGKFCKKLDIRFIRPRELRKTRINWLLRRSRDPALAAEMHSHSQETLIRSYEQPSFQSAIVEINRFHATTDPSIAPPGAGVCVNASPMPIPGIPSEATIPDCISPAGCLFCVHHRDIDSEDHIWSLASYGYLKSLELTGYRPSIENNLPHPAMASVERISEKLRQIEESSGVRRAWVREARARIAEDDHHPRWEGFIRLKEIRL